MTAGLQKTSALHRIRWALTREFRGLPDPKRSGLLMPTPQFTPNEIDWAIVKFFENVHGLEGVAHDMDSEGIRKMIRTMYSPRLTRSVERKDYPLQEHDSGIRFFRTAYDTTLFLHLNNQLVAMEAFEKKK